MDLEVRIATTGQELTGALELRYRVFVQEQGVPAELEHDEQDATALHVVALQQGSVIGTGRLVSESGTAARIGRMAVAAHLRRMGVGSEVLSCLEQQARSQGKQTVLLHAQLAVRGFYDYHGYTAQGEEFEEAGIRHVTMVKVLV